MSVPNHYKLYSEKEQWLQALNNKKKRKQSNKLKVLKSIESGIDYKIKYFQVKYTDFSFNMYMPLISNITRFEDVFRQYFSMITNCS